VDKLTTKAGRNKANQYFATMRFIIGTIKYTVGAAVLGEPAGSTSTRHTPMNMTERIFTDFTPLLAMSMPA
jgi:hypothetical protein